MIIRIRSFLCLIVALTMTQAMAGGDILIVNTTSDIYKIDEKTGQATLVRNFNISEERTIYDIASSRDSFYGISRDGRFQLLNTENNSFSRVRTVSEGSVSMASTSNSHIVLARGPDVYEYKGLLGTERRISRLPSEAKFAEDMAFDDQGRLYAVVNRSGSETNWLVGINRKTGVSTYIGEIGFRPVRGISFKDGKLYGNTGNGEFIKIDTNTGEGSQIGFHGINVYGQTTRKPETGDLFNISTRGSVIPGSNMIAGFIIHNSPKKVILRGFGPTLKDRGVTGPTLSDPQIELFSGQDSIGFNDNWIDSSDKNEIMETGMEPDHNTESAILLTLEPGPYTLILRSSNGESGEAIVSVTQVDE